MRGGAAFTTFPNVELPMSPSTAVGPLNCVWLKTLNASTRKSSDFDSVNGRFVVVRSRTEKESPPRCARCPGRVPGERRCIEIVVPVGTWIAAQVQRGSVVIRLIDAAVIHAVRIGPDQRVVAVVDHGHGKTAGEARNAGKGPAIRQPAGVKPPIEGKLVFVAHDKIMLHIERRQRIAERRVEGIDLFPDVRRLIHRFAEGIGGGKLQAP